MDILENREQWDADYRAGWLAHLEQTGQFDWKQYVHPKNSTAPSGPAIELSKSRLMLISSAGAYLPASQEPFDAPHPLGDYSIRVLPSSTPFAEIAYAHDHYDHSAVNADPQVLLPLRHLETLVTEGIIGELAPSVINFSGYMPDVNRLIDETIPQMLKVAKEEEVRAVLLVPA